jgi:hypothetical protein
MRNLLDLINDGFGDVRVNVADAGGQDAAKTIEILVALLVPDVHARAAFERERLLVIHSDGRVKKLFVLLHSRRENWQVVACAHVAILL